MILSYCMMIVGGRINLLFFFFNDTATTEIYTLSLHDALPILATFFIFAFCIGFGSVKINLKEVIQIIFSKGTFNQTRSEEHTSELQSRQYLVCRLLLEKKKKQQSLINIYINRTKSTLNYLLMK